MIVVCIFAAALPDGDDLGGSGKLAAAALDDDPVAAPWRSI